MVKKMVFISGTRADYGKIKPLIKKISKKKKNRDIYLCHRYAFN